MENEKKADKLRLMLNRKTCDSFELEQLMNSYETSIEVEEE